MKTIGHIEQAMRLLNERIAREPRENVWSSDREIFGLLREARPGISALIEEHEDGECYCPENLAVKTTCPHCRAKNQNWITETQCETKKKSAP